ncbi:MAG: CAP domain-containing protein [Trueperaceae bacterium]
MNPQFDTRTRSRPADAPPARRLRRPSRHALLTAAFVALMGAVPLACTWTAAPGGAVPTGGPPVGEAAAGPTAPTLTATGAAPERGAATPGATPLPTPAGSWLLPGIDDVAEPNPDLVAALHVAADEARAAHGAQATVWDEGLARAARQHAAELAARNVLDHQGLEPDRRTVADRLARVGSPYATHAENLAAVPSGLDAVRATLDGWLQSPGHRANLLAPDFDRVGYGTAVGADGTVFVTQVLARAPWAPSDWSAALLQVGAVRLTLELAVAEPTTVLIDVDGAQAQPAFAAGAWAWTTEVAAPGPWEVLVAVPGSAPGRFTLDDAGTVGGDGRWRPDDGRVRPRESVRVRSASVAEGVREVVRLRLTLPTPAAQLVVGAVQLPGANRGGGSIEAELELADGAELLMGLAEPRDDGALAVRHRWLLRRDGASIAWAARP